MDDALTATEILISLWRLTHARLGTFYQEQAVPTDSEATPNGASPEGPAVAAASASTGAAPDPAQPDAEVTHTTETAHVLVVDHAHVSKLHEYIDGIERHTVIEWEKFIAFVREHFPKPT